MCLRPRQEFANYAHDLVTDVACLSISRLILYTAIFIFHLHSELKDVGI